MGESREKGWLRKMKIFERAITFIHKKEKTRRPNQKRKHNQISRKKKKQRIIADLESQIRKLFREKLALKEVIQKIRKLLHAVSQQNKIPFCD